MKIIIKNYWKVVVDTYREGCSMGSIGDARLQLIQI